MLVISAVVIAGLLLVWRPLIFSSVDPEVAADVEMLQDLVVAAVNEAMDQSREMAANRMQEVTAGLGLPPGLV